jgi:drug/metabolite transporter (DMT)-like permease
LLAALGFGFYFPWMHAAGKVDFWWASLIFRTTALLLIASAVAVRRPQLRLTRRQLTIVFAVGIGDTIGNALFAASSGQGLVSLTAVLASLYPIVTVILAGVVLHERVAPLQKAGIALTLTGVVLIAF